MHLAFCLLGLAGSIIAQAPALTPVPEGIRREFKLAEFYQKHASAGGVPIVASAKVHDAALLEAQFLIEKMIGHRPEILAAIARHKVRLAIMAPDEFTTDVPEHSDLRPRAHWDKRARGLGATAARPAVSCGEENLLGYKGDPYAAENILVHEFGHVIHEQGLKEVDPTFDTRLRTAFDSAKERGLWAGKYAGTNRMEYWAEGVQSWFDTNREDDHDHNHVNTRQELRDYDAPLAALCAEVFGDGAWRYQRPEQRQPASPHLAAFDPAKAPTFTWKVLYARVPAGGKDDTLGLELLAPPSRPDWRSPQSDRPASVAFSNQTGKTVVVEWVDWEGRPAQKFTMRPGVLQMQRSYAGHVFRVSEAEGAVLGYYVAGERDGAAVLRR